jgi:DnaJ-class molecular chaperone
MGLFSLTSTNSVWLSGLLCAEHLDGHEVLVDRLGQISTPKQIITIVSEGMPKHNTPSEHGDLLLEIFVSFPSSLDEATQDEIRMTF